MKWISKSEKDTSGIAVQFMEIIKRKGSNGHSRLVALSGELGSGKTTFVKYCAELLGINETVTSPTFVILKPYPIRNKKFPYEKMVHVDAYRLNKESDLYVIGIRDYLDRSNNLIFMEWPERIGLDQLKNSIKLEFSHVNEHTRMIEMTEN